MHLMASLGMDTSDYEQSIEEAKEQTKSSVASMTKDYNRLYSDVLHLTAAYQKSSKETGENSKATKDLKQKLSDAQKQLDATARGLNTAQQYMDSFSKKTDTAGNSLASAMTKAQLLASAVQTAARKIKDLAVGFVQTGMQYNAQIETYRTALTNMLGDAEKANAMLTSIKRDAARTPFSTDALVAANQYLLSAGENAEYSQKTILALGDAIKATGGGDDELNRMAQNLQQVANVGKASAVDIKQFAFAGINIYQVLADYTGKSVQEVQNMTVTYDVLTQALQAAAEEGGRYYGSMETQSETLSGRITTLQDNAKQLAGELSTGLSSAYGTVVEKANEWVTSILSDDEKLQQLNTTVTVVTAAIAAGTSGFIAYRTAMAISGVISAVRNATEGMTIAQAALNAVMAANPVAIVVTALTALAGGLATAYAANEDFREGWNSAWSSIKDWFSSVADYILDKLNVIMAVANGVGNAIAALGRLESPVDAYNAAYHQTRQNYADNKTRQRQKDGGHARRTSNGGMWSDKLPNTASNAVISSIAPSTGGTTSKKKAASTKSTTETVIASVSNTVTTSAMNALGAVTTSVETLQEKVKDSAGKIKDRVTTTTTETGKEMVNGVATTYKKVNTVVDGVVTKTTKVYDDMSKTLTGTLTKVAETTFDGITTKIQEATEKYADGSEHIKKTVTETGQRIGKNGAETYEKIITYIDGVQDKVTETSNEIDKSVKGTQSRIDKNLSGISEELNKGIFGLVKNFFNDAQNGNWGNLALDFVNLIWGEVSQDQRDALMDWGHNALKAINEGYFSGGIGKALESIQSIFTNGITAGVDGATTSVKAFSEIVQGLASSGGVGGALGSIVQGFSGMAGGITSALGTVVSFISANPVLGIILGVGAAGAAAGGIGLALWAKNKKSKDPVNNYKSPFDDVGVYDSLNEFSTRSAMQYRVIGQSSHADKQTSILERIEELLDEHLPAIGTGQVVMDSGELVGVISPRMAQNVDARIGVTVTRKARGV
jgi:tape measure domain-containing protein